MTVLPVSSSFNPVSVRVPNVDFGEIIENVNVESLTGM